MTVYPDADAAAYKWPHLNPQFNDWQDEHIYKLCKDALNVIYKKELSDSYKRGYSKTIFHAIQNITLTKTEKQG